VHQSARRPKARVFVDAETGARARLDAERGGTEARHALLATVLADLDEARAVLSLAGRRHASRSHGRDVIMRVDRRTALQLILAASSAVLFTGQASALEREKNGFYMTGSGVRVKKKGPFTGKVYSISHYMRELPPAKTKEAVIAMETDKVFSWRMLRDVDAEKIHEALNEGFAKNGYADRARSTRLSVPSPRSSRKARTSSSRTPQDRRRRPSRSRAMAPRPSRAVTSCAAPGASGWATSTNPR